MANETGREPLDPSGSSEAAPTSKSNQEPVHLMVSGSRWGIKVMIHTLFKLGIAPVDAWSKPQQIPHSNRLMSVVTKYIQKPKKSEKSKPSNQDD